MATESHIEGIVDTHTQAPPKAVTRNENEREGILASSRPQSVDVIQQQYVSPQSNMVTSMKVPPIMPEGDDAPRVTPLHQVNENPTWINCPNCQRRTKTKITKEDTSMQMVAGILLCLFCICLACAPCLCGWCQNTHIHCSSCGTRIATIPHDGPMQLAPIAMGRE
ncbi:hypothetical protein M434DRAFT_400883 [Hypoxylon sp. CO27-5]|nr:hypothetical protein M434DRAFT_400883 [Hypoxylon sp. CO27-5]